MLRAVQQFFNSYDPLQIAIELIVIWFCVWLVFRFLRGTRGAGIIKGVALVLVVGTLLIRVVGQANDAFARLNFIYDRFLGIAAILLIVVFQQELRQAMIRLGHAWSFRGSREATNVVVDAVAGSVEFLSRNQFGALIAIEREAQLGGLTDTGVQLDAAVGAPLLEAIFWPNSPLHDLGVVIRGDRVVAATVQFPLAEEGVLPPRFGSRHRAAAGLSLESDCVVVIVSEENGAVSIAEHGRLDYDLPRERFRELLAARLELPSEPSRSRDAAPEGTPATAPDPSHAT